MLVYYQIAAIYLPKESHLGFVFTISCVLYCNNFFLFNITSTLFHLVWTAANFCQFFVNSLTGTASLFLRDCYAKSLQYCSIFSKWTHHSAVSLMTHSRNFVVWNATNFSIIFCLFSQLSYPNFLVWLLHQVPVTFLWTATHISFILKVNIPRGCF